nr:uncharacterized protein LOC128695975 [Cherax quadricarinatus]
MYRILTVLLLLTTTSATVFQDCGSVGSPVTVDIEDCELPPCVLSRGHLANATVQYTASEYI